MATRRSDQAMDHSHSPHGSAVSSASAQLRMAGTDDDGTPHARGRRGRDDRPPSHLHGNRCTTMTNRRSKQNKAKESPSHSLPSAAAGSNPTPACRSSQRHKGTPQRHGMMTRATSGARQQVPASAGTAIDAKALAPTTPPPMGTSVNTLCSSPPTDIPSSINAPSTTNPSSTSAPTISSTDILHMVSQTDIPPSTVAPSASSANNGINTPSSNDPPSALSATVAPYVTLAASAMAPHIPLASSAMAPSTALDDTYSFSSEAPSINSTSTSTSVNALMQKHLPPSGTATHSPMPTPLVHTGMEVNETFKSLQHQLKETIRVEAEFNFQTFLAEYKSGMTKATSTVFKKWEDIVKEWEDTLKKVDSSLVTAQRELSSAQLRMTGTDDDGTPHARGRRGRDDRPPSHLHGATSAMNQPTLSRGRDDRPHSHPPHHEGMRDQSLSLSSEKDGDTNGLKTPTSATSPTRLAGSSTTRPTASSTTRHPRLDDSYAATWHNNSSTNASSQALHAEGLQLLCQRERDDYASSQSLRMSPIADSLQLPRQRADVVLRQRERDEWECKALIACSLRDDVTLVDKTRMLKYDNGEQYDNGVSYHDGVPYDDVHSYDEGGFYDPAPAGSYDNNDSTNVESYSNEGPPASDHNDDSNNLESYSNEGPPVSDHNDDSNKHDNSYNDGYDDYGDIGYGNNGYDDYSNNGYDDTYDSDKYDNGGYSDDSDGFYSHW